jgi:hypothetical protein
MLLGAVSGFGDLGHQGSAIGHHALVGGLRPVPFQHGELGVMKRTALGITKHAGELIDFRQARHQQLFHGELGRGVERARA